MKSYLKYLFLGISLLVVFGFYVSTMMPSQDFHDAGEFQTAIPTVNIGHPTGYPTYILLGKLIITLIPVGELAWRVNLLSVIYSTVVLGFGAGALILLTKNTVWPVLGLLIFGFSKNFWNHSGIAEAHTLERAFLATLIFLFVLGPRYEKKAAYWGLIGLTFGLGFGNHLLLLYSLPGFLIWAVILFFQKKLHLRFKHLGVLLLGGLLGILVYLWLPIRQLLGPTILNNSVLSWAGFYRHVGSQDTQGIMLQGGWPVILDNMIKGLEFMQQDFGTLVMGFGLFGIGYGLCFYFAFTISLLVMFGGYLLFSMNYPTGDPTRYYSSFMFVYSLFVGLGLVGLGNTITFTLEKIKVPPVFRYLLLGILLISLLFIPLRYVETNFLLVDKSKNFAAKEYSGEIFASVPPNSVIISWWNYSTPMWYRRYALAERLDITIENRGQGEWLGYVEKYIATRPVFLVAEESTVSNVYRVVPEGRLHHVYPK